MSGRRHEYQPIMVLSDPDVVVQPTLAFLTHVYSFGGAGLFGILHLFKPDFFGFRPLLNCAGKTPINGNILECTDNGNPVPHHGSPYEFSDMFIASVFLSFATFSVIGILHRQNPALMAPVMCFQCLYKAYWCVFWLIGWAAGAVVPTWWSFLYWLIMFSYVPLDAYVFVCPVLLHRKPTLRLMPVMDGQP